jgi:trans-aconitate 2-methyltransferase
LYQSSHSFVWEFGRDLVQLLAPEPGDRILDIGCGTGQLTETIARSGAEVLGVDRSAEMIAQARSNYPALAFEIGDAAALPYTAEFDAVFSNAVLHWVKDARGAVAGVARALKPGGRFVAEFGGRGNVRRLVEAVCGALELVGLPDPQALIFPALASTPRSWRATAWRLPTRPCSTA